MFKQNELLKSTMIAFPGSFINHNNELILVEKTNLYFLLNNIDNELEFKCKLLEWCSRDASKAMPYRKNWLNEAYWSEVRNGINNVLKTDFDHSKMEVIYDRLGNQINRNLTIKFIESGYDMNVLRSDES